MKKLLILFSGLLIFCVFFTYVSYADCNTCNCLLDNGTCVTSQSGNIKFCGAINGRANCYSGTCPGSGGGIQ